MLIRFFPCFCLLLLAFIRPLAAANATMVGSAACIDCHPDQGKAWQSSHHAASMQAANERTVLGDFADVRFVQATLSSRFFRRDGRFWVNTEGPDGRARDFEIRYTFGIYPLQQYLIELADGHIQALGIAWDAQPRAEGGQRWFALYPDNPPRAGDPVHWSGRDQNWNFMCASCHSTGVQRNFDLTGKRFASRWAEINVACEACHGPGSHHQAWAKTKAAGGDMGLVVPLGALDKVLWRFTEPMQKIASPVGDVAAAKRAEEACYGCHSRRQELRVQAQSGAPFLDNYLPSLLEPTLYHADGQIDGEVFEYGSFVQSRMHRAGVTCANCHQTHSLKLRAEGNALCGQCHRSEYYDQASHHHHAPASAGAQCINCHMPQKTYMGVHQRHDHGFRIPAPARSSAIGAPNACTGQCHADRDAAWAAEQMQHWVGPDHGEAPHFASSLAAAHAGDGRHKVLAGGLDAAWPGIARATTLSSLRPPATRQAAEDIARAAKDSDGLVRLGAARAISALPPANALTIGTGLLSDPLRAVRVEAARSLAGTPKTALSPQLAKRLRAALNELIEVEQASADRPESQVNLSQIYANQGNAAGAEQALKNALHLDPGFVPALVSLADLYRALGRDGEGETLLRRAAGLAPAAAEPRHALGLLLIRRGRLADALPWLAEAVERDGQNSRYAQVLALAHMENKAPAAALDMLRAARQRLPGDLLLLETLIGLEKQLGHGDAVRQLEAEYRRLLE